MWNYLLDFPFNIYNLAPLWQWQVAILLGHNCLKSLIKYKDKWSGQHWSRRGNSTSSHLPVSLLTQLHLEVVWTAPLPSSSHNNNYMSNCCDRNACKSQTVYGYEFGANPNCFHVEPGCCCCCRLSAIWWITCGLFHPPLPCMCYTYAQPLASPASPHTRLLTQSRISSSIQYNLAEIWIRFKAVDDNGNWAEFLHTTAHTLRNTTQ